MTSTPVKNVGFGLGGPTQAGAGARVSIDSGFQTVWNNQTGKQTDNTGQPEDSRTVKKTPGDSLKARDEHRARTEKREPSRNVEERTDIPEEIPEEKLEEAAEVLGTAAVQLTQEVAAEFGVEPEEVQAIMADLGMEQADVLSAQGFSSLILAVSGEESPQALLTNEELYSSYQELMGQLETVLQECGEALEVSPEQLMQLTELTKPVSQEQEQQFPVVEVTEEVIRTEITEELQRPQYSEELRKPEEVRKPEELQKPEEMRKPEEIQKPEEMRKPEKVTDEKPQDSAETFQSAEQKTAEQTRNDGNAGENQNQNRKENRHEGGREQNLNLFSQNFRTEQFEPQIQQTEHAESVWDTDTQNIMRQIMDYMKVNLKADMSTMEMQLHPASLGTLQVQLASKGGVVTANFITQSEAVKAALESQMIQLQERFEEQGVKVQAIEVTVQTHQFEQNLEQGRRGGQEQESARKGRIRKINLNDPIPAEEMEEEDALTRDIMTASGSTVDYTA